MKPSLTDALCTRCGLCCDGSLFADVELTGRGEATRLEVLGLEIEDDGARGELLVQPCAALQGTRCSIYAHRPKCCRTFECRLLQDTRRGTVSVESAVGTITEALGLAGRAKALLAQLGHGDQHLPLKERVAEALAGEAGGDRRAGSQREELGATMAALERLIQRSFMGGEKMSEGGQGARPSRPPRPDRHS